MKTPADKTALKEALMREASEHAAANLEQLTPAQLAEEIALLT